MKKVLVALGVLAVPSLAAAQGGLGNIETLLTSVGRLVDIATPIVVGIALLAFFWGLAKFVFSAGNEDQKTDGKKLMGWGILALFVMLSIWGLVDFIGDAVGIGDGGQKDPPSVILS